MPTCQGRYAPPEAVALLLPQARTILKYALFYHGTGHLQKILNIAYAAGEICFFADCINGLPRKILGYKTPEELFDCYLDRIYTA